MDLNKTISSFFNERCRVGESCVVAVSGGADSMALLYLTHHYHNHTKTGRFHRIISATVDHGLRPESSDEAKQVGKWCEGLGFEHALLTWEGPKPKAAIQKKARQARYQLLSDFCKVRGAKYLITGHHKEDQLETFFLRLFKGSSVRGLAGMSAHREILDSITLLRPLLECTRESLEVYLKTCNQPFISDPSNDNSDFERVRLRQMITFMRQKGFNVDAISDTIKHITIEDTFVRTLTKEHRSHVFSSDTFDTKIFLRLDPFLQRELLRDIVWSLSQKNHPPKFRDVDALLQKVQEGKNFTCAGYVWRYDKDLYTLHRECKVRRAKNVPLL